MLTALSRAMNNLPHIMHQPRDNQDKLIVIQ
jgi:hypothetical protein